MKKSDSVIQKILPLFATLFVVIGLAAIVLSIPKNVALTEQASSIVIDTPTSSVPFTVLQEGDVLHLMGVSMPHDCTLPTSSVRVTRVAVAGIDLIAEDGTHLRLGLDCTVQDVRFPPGLLNPSDTHGVRLGDPRKDGAAAIVISDGKEESTIILRGQDGRPYRDPVLIGWMDGTHVAASASQGDSRHLLVVETTGRVMKRATLSEMVGDVAAGGGFAWYVTVTPGEGIEFGPRGPSEIHRVSADGSDAVVARDEQSALESLSVGPAGHFAASVGDAILVGQQTAVKKSATGRVIGWTESGALMIARNGRLALIQSDGLVTDTDLPVSEQVTAAWRPVLDDDMWTR